MINVGLIGFKLEYFKTLSEILGPFYSLTPLDIKNSNYDVIVCDKLSTTSARILEFSAFFPKTPTLFLHVNNIEAFHYAGPYNCLNGFWYDAITIKREINALLSTNLLYLQKMDDEMQDNVNDPHYFLGKSLAAQEIRKQIHLFAPNYEPVLIMGETGTGKELVAQNIHKFSLCGKEEMVELNCAQFSESLIERELFGSMKGSFTGAITAPGCFEIANNSSMFLDEIGELNPSVQSNFLRVLETHTFSRLGECKKRTSNARIISATNRNLQKQEVENKFRLDLYHRISVLTIIIPPLRERKEDIPILVTHFLKNYPAPIHDSALEKITEHTWPGNIRELKNVLKRACILSRNLTITPNNINF